MIPGQGQFGPQRLDWQDLCRGSLNIGCGPDGFREGDLLIFSIISLRE